MTRWVFDIGNTRLKCAPVHEDGRIGEVTALAHGDHARADELESLLPSRGDWAYVCSVASPQRSLATIELLATRFRGVSTARTTSTFAGVRNGYPVPSKLGVDRFMAMVAARARAPGAWLVCGVGTALTVDLLDPQGVHRGGRIAPSPSVMRAALRQAAPHLPLQGGHYQSFAVDTEAALVSGCDGAAIGLIQHSLAEATALLGAAPAILLHGGGAGSLAGRLGQVQHEPSLVLQGLASWAMAGALPAPADLESVPC